MSSSGQASNLIKFLEASASEVGRLCESTFAAVKALSGQLAGEGYEHVADATAREAAIEQRLQEFKQSLADHRPKFEDAKKREAFKEEVRFASMRPLVMPLCVHVCLCASVCLCVCDCVECKLPRFLQVQEPLSSVSLSFVCCV